MTPKLKLSDAARKTLLSCILKFLLVGIWRTIMSMQMMLAPMTHAVRCEYLHADGRDNVEDGSRLEVQGHIPMPLITDITQPLVSLLIRVSMMLVSAV
jgi:hypothetical protein